MLRKSIDIFRFTFKAPHPEDLSQTLNPLSEICGTEL